MFRSIKKHRNPKKRRFNPPLNTVVSHQLSVFSAQQHQVELPEDLIFSEILTRLPVKSLTQFRSVSKTWNSFISTTQFIKSHLKQTFTNPYVPNKSVFIRSPYYFYIMNYDAYDRCPYDQKGQRGLVQVKNLSFNDNGVNTFMIGSCNGLVCFGRGSMSNNFDYCFHVYNPVMGKSCHVIDPLGNFQWNLMYGFGYVDCLNDYLLFVGGLQKRCSETFVYVCSLRSEMWRKIGTFGDSELAVLAGGRGVLVNETLHWDMNQVRTRNGRSICGFDLGSESFKDIPMPVGLVGNDGNMDFRLCEMGGCLSAWAKDVNGMVEMWTLTKYGVWDSWIKVFKIDLVPGLRGFCGYTENGKVLVQTDDGSLLLADPDPDHSAGEGTMLVKDLGDIDVVSYVQSLVSPL